MPLSPVNHPPAPVQESVGVAVPATDDCAAIKDEFGIDTNSYSGHSGKTPSGSQSHHVFQNAAASDIISKGSALCIILVGGSAVPGSEHKAANDAQNERMRNKGGAGTQPAATFGELKDLSKQDLSKALAGKRVSKKTGKPMTKEEADKAADCVVAEAEKKAKEKYAENNPGKTLNDSTGKPPLKTPGGCLVRGTLVWMAGGDLVAVEDVRPGDWILTSVGPQAVVRVEGCHHDLVEIDFGDDVLTIASFHRVLLADGSQRRADGLRAGDVVSTAAGTRVVAGMIGLGPRLEPVYRIGCAGPAICAIGRAGVWTVMREARLPIDRHEIVVPFVSEEVTACPS